MGKAGEEMAFVRPYLSALLVAFLSFVITRWSAPSSLMPAASAESQTTAKNTAPEGKAGPKKNEDAVASEVWKHQDKPLPQQLTLTFHNARPFESASRAVAIVDAMTTEDFQKMLKSPFSVVPDVYGMDKEFSEGFLKYLVQRWLDIDPTGALAGIRQLEATLKKNSSGGQGEFYRALAQLRPEMILDGLTGKEGRLDAGSAAAFTSLASRNPTAARAYLEQLRDPEQRKTAEVAIAQGVAKGDPVAAVALALGLKSSAVLTSAIAEAERIGPGVLRQVLLANNGVLPIGMGLTELILRHPGEDWEGLVGDPASNDRGLTMGMSEEADRLTAEDRKRLLDNLERLPAAVRERVAGAVLMSWSQQDAKSATEWAFQRAKPNDLAASETERVSIGFHRWAREKKEEAISWWSALPASPLRDQLSLTLIHQATDQRELDQVLAIAGSLSPQAREGAVRAIAKQKAKADPADAAQWLAGLPPETDLRKAVQDVVHSWATKDVTAAAHWIENLPDGPRREAAVQAYTLAIAQVDPFAAGEWARAIQDPRSRLGAATVVYERMQSQDPPAARAWIRAFRGVDETMRDRLIRLRR